MNERLLSEDNWEWNQLGGGWWALWQAAGHTLKSVHTVAEQPDEADKLLADLDRWESYELKLDLEKKTLDPLIEVIIDRLWDDRVLKLERPKTWIGMTATIITVTDWIWVINWIDIRNKQHLTGTMRTWPYSDWNWKWAWAWVWNWGYVYHICNKWWKLRYWISN